MTHWSHTVIQPNDLKPSSDHNNVTQSVSDALSIFLSSHKSDHNTVVLITEYVLNQKKSLQCLPSKNACDLLCQFAALAFRAWHQPAVEPRCIAYHQRHSM